VETKFGNFLGCVYVESPHSEPRYTLLFSHPNGSDISDHLTGIPSLQDTAAFLNCNIVAYDYSGYGISSDVQTNPTCMPTLKPSTITYEQFDV